VLSAVVVQLESRENEINYRQVRNTDLPGNNRRVISVDFHEDHINVVIGHVFSNRVTHSPAKLGHGDSALFLLVGLVEEVLKHL